MRHEYKRRFPEILVANEWTGRCTSFYPPEVPLMRHGFTCAINITFKMIDQLSRDLDVLDEISRQEISAADAKAVVRNIFIP